MENVGLRVRNIPTGRDIRLNCVMFVFLYERAEHDLEEAFRTGIDANTRIKCSWRLIERHRHCARVCRGSGHAPGKQNGLQNAESTREKHLQDMPFAESVRP